MARDIYSRLKIEGTLTAIDPLHVGGFGESPDTDLPLALNGEGKFYIPGTSICGVLRSWCQKCFGETETEKLFGLKQIKASSSGFASFVIVDDVLFNDNIQSEIRDGVGIDRMYGAAADKAKYDRAVLPKGADLQIKIIAEMQEPQVAKTKAIFGYLLDELNNSKLRFGASRTRGLGRVKLTKLRQIEEQKLINILDWLDGTSSSKDLEDNASIKTEIEALKNDSIAFNPIPQLQITIAWQPKSALMVKAGYEGIGVDTLPLTSGNGKGRVSLVLPGSSIKGAFRADAERIIRTFKNPKHEKDFNEQMKLEIINELFGAKKEKKSENEHLGLGALSPDDCYAIEDFDVDTWNNLVSGKMVDDANYSSQDLWQALKAIDGDDKGDSLKFKISHHVAIDRWTGGASECALYSVLEPTSAVKWNDICLTLDLSRFNKKDGSPDETLRKTALMLLLLVLRDFAQNRIPLGFAVNRGLGEVKEVSFETNGFYDIKWKDNQIVFKDDNLKSSLEKEWKTWISKNQSPSN